MIAPAKIIDNSTAARILERTDTYIVADKPFAAICHHHSWYSLICRRLTTPINSLHNNDNRLAIPFQRPTAQSDDDDTTTTTAAATTTTAPKSYEEEELFEGWDFGTDRMMVGDAAEDTTRHHHPRP